MATRLGVKRSTALIGAATLDNGDQIDVQLDEGFNVIGTEEDGPNDD